MTTEQFVVEVAGYSGGDYTEQQLTAVTEWAEKRNAIELDKVYALIVQDWDTRYKTPPAVKHLAHYFAEVNPYGMGYEVQSDGSIAYVQPV